MFVKKSKPACRRGKIICAMSGGVDSSVAAAILKTRGYDVVGVFMLMHKNSNPHDARIVAKKLGIKFKIIDVRREFKKRVVDYFVSEYKKGNTPNPCVECNRWIKFNFLIREMLKQKADYVATGHYAKTKNKKLFTAKDTKKDQTYFLWRLNQKQLSKIIFPLGDYTKEQVRGMARKFNLPVAEKKDSQEICFAVPRRSFARAKAGDILTTEGKKIGEHKGLIFYTIGQRKGIKIGGIGPFYVVDKDFKNNALIVAQSDFNEALYKKEMIVKNVNWISKPKRFSIHCNVKIRYGHKAVPCVVSKTKIKFLNPQRAITPGQSAVFYLKNEVLGGGVIM